MKKKITSKLLKILIVSILLFTATFSISYAWFQGYIQKNGTKASTGEIKSQLNAYTLQGTTLEQGAKNTSDTYSLTSFESSILYTVDEFDQVIKNEAEIYFIVEKESGSIDFDYYIYFNLEDPDNCIPEEAGFSQVAYDSQYRYIGGFYYRFSKINESITFNTNALTSLTAYATQATLPTNTGDILSLAYLESRAITKGRLAGTDSYDYYRLTIGINDTATVAQYADKTIRIRTSIHTSQLNALDVEEGTGTVISVSTAAALDNALATYLPGDTVKIISSFEYGKDLVFSRPVNFSIMGSTLTVSGNVIFDTAYPDEIKIDTSEGGILQIKRLGTTGGNLEILCPNSKVELIGKGSSSSAGDYFIQGGMYISAGYGDQTGCYFTGTNIYNTTGSGAIPSQAAYYSRKDITFLNNTKFVVAASTRLGKIVPIINMSLGATPEIFWLVNSGVVDEVNLSTMVEATGTEYELVPQILIDSYGQFIADYITLPSWSKRFWTNLPEDNGNTRVIQRMGAKTLHISPSCTTFTDVDIESSGSIDYVIDTSGTYLLGRDLIIHYFDNAELGENNTIQSILTSYYQSIGVSGTLDENLQNIRTLQIISYYNKNLTSNDFTFIKRMIYLQTIDLSGATLVSNAMPNSALSGLSELSKVTLPTTVTRLNNYFISGTRVQYISIPKTVNTIEGSCFYGPVRFVYIENTTDIFPCTSSSYKVMYIVPDNMHDKYTSNFGDEEWRSYIRPRGKVADDNNSLYRFRSDGSVELLGAYTLDPYISNGWITFDQIVIEGTSYPIASIFTRAFIRNRTNNVGTSLCSEGIKLRFGAGLKNLENWVFYQSPQITEIDFSACSDVTVNRGCFYQNAKLEVIAFPTSGGWFGPECFRFCYKLNHTAGDDEYIINGNGISFLGDYCFQDCDKIISFKSNSLRSVQCWPFYSCENLREIEVLNLEYCYSGGICAYTNLIKLAVGPIKANQGHDQLFIASNSYYLMTFAYVSNHTDGWFEDGGGFDNPAYQDSVGVRSYRLRLFNGGSRPSLFYGDPESYNYLYNTLLMSDLCYYNATVAGTTYDDYFTVGSNNNELFYDSGMYLCRFVDLEGGGRGISITCCYDRFFDEADEEHPFEIPDTINVSGVDYPVVDIGYAAFASNRITGNFSFGDNVKTVNNYAFDNATGFTKTFTTLDWANVESLGAYSFRGLNCTTLTFDRDIIFNSYVFTKGVFGTLSFTGMETAGLWGDYSKNGADFYQAKADYLNLGTLKYVGRSEFQEFSLTEPTEISSNNLIEVYPYSFWNMPNVTKYSSTSLNVLWGYAFGGNAALREIYFPHSQWFQQSYTIASASHLIKIVLGNAISWRHYPFQSNNQLCEVFVYGSQEAAHSDTTLTKYREYFCQTDGVNPIKTYCTSSMYAYLYNMEGSNKCIPIITGDIDPSMLFTVGSYEVDYYEVGEYVCYNGASDASKLRVYAWNRLSVTDDEDVIVPNTIGGRAVESYVGQMLKAVTINTTGDIIIQPGITRIPDRFCQYNNKYTKVYDQLILNDVEYIGMYAFYTNSMNSIQKNNKVKELEYNAFGYCPLITDVEFPQLEKAYGFIFRNCAALIRAYCPKLTYFGRSQSGDLSGQFYCCYELKEVYIGSVWYDWGGDFTYCNKLQNVFICGGPTPGYSDDSTVYKRCTWNWWYTGSTAQQLDAIRVFVSNAAYTAPCQNYITSGVCLVNTGDINPQYLIGINNDEVNGITIKGDIYYINSSNKATVISVKSLNETDEVIIDEELGTETVIPKDVTLPSTVEYNSVTYPIISYVGAAYRKSTIDITGTLTIPNSVKNVGDYSFYLHKFTVLVADGVQSIGKYAFYENTRLAGVTLPACEYIYDYAFSHNTAMQTVNLASIRRIEQYAFGSTASTYAMPIDTFIFGGNFEYWATNSCRTWYGTNVYLMNRSGRININTDPLMEGSTYDASNLYVSSTVLSLYKASQWCHMRTNRMYSFDFQQSYGDITYFFNTVSASNTSELIITSIIGDFNGTRFTVPDSLNYNGVSTPVCEIYNTAFGTLNATLTEIVLPNTYKYYNYLEGASINGLQAFVFAYGSNDCYMVSDGVLYSKDGKVLVGYPKAKAGATFAIPDTVERVSKNAFYKATNLTKIEVPTSATASDSITFMTSSINACTLLTKIEFARDCNLFNNAFIGCTRLNELDFYTNFDYDSGTQDDLIMFVSYTEQYSDNTSCKVYIPQGTYTRGYTSYAFKKLYTDANIYSPYTIDKFVEVANPNA